MKILSTGVHGFVGSNLVKALSREHEIFGLDIIAPMKDGVKFTFGWKHLDGQEISQYHFFIEYHLYVAI